LNLYRFLRADFRPCFVIVLGNTSSITCGQCRACTKIRSGKTALHISASNVRGILDAEDAGLLTQVKDDKSKSAGQGRRNAALVQFLSDKGSK
jgi:hypothetical protein